MKASQEDNLNRWKLNAYRSVSLVAMCALIWVVLYIAGVLWQAVATVVVAALIAFLLHGLVNRLERAGVPRIAGTSIGIVGLLVVIAGVFATFIPALVTQVSNFVTNIPTYSNQLRSFVSEHSDAFGQFMSQTQVNEFINTASDWITQQGAALVSNAAGGLLGGVIGLGNGLLIFFIGLLCAFWVLIDLPKMSREVRSLFSDRYQDDIDIITDAFGNAVYGWVKSTFACAVIVGVVNGVAYALLSMPYSVVLGFLCGVLYIVPYIGPAIACVVVAIIGIIVSPITCVVAIIVNVIVNNVVANVISPKLMSSSVNVHPAIVLVVILVGGALGGMWGMLLSIPIAASVQGVFITYFETRTGKTLATADGALFQKKPETSVEDMRTKVTQRFNRVKK